MNKILDADSLYMARMVRQIPIFGIEGQKRIAETPVAIVGCGGNGSLMALGTLTKLHNSSPAD